MGLLDRPTRPVTGLLSSYPRSEKFALSSPDAQMPRQFVGMWASGLAGLRPTPDQQNSHPYSRAVPASEQRIQMVQFIPIPLPEPGGPRCKPPPKPPRSNLPPSFPFPLPTVPPIFIPLPLPRVGGDDPPRSPPSNPPRRRKKTEDVCEEEKENRDRLCSTELRSKQGISRCKSRSFTLYGDCLAGKLEGRFDPRDFAHYQ